jgi:hypothetical protein
MRTISVSLPQAANGRFAAVISAAPMMGRGRQRQFAVELPATSASDKSRTQAAGSDSPLRNS